MSSLLLQGVFRVFLVVLIVVVVVVVVVIVVVVSSLFFRLGPQQTFNMQLFCLSSLQRKQRNLDGKNLPYCKLYISYLLHLQLRIHTLLKIQGPPVQLKLL